MANYQDAILNQIVKRKMIPVGITLVNKMPLATFQYKGAYNYASIAAAAGGDLTFKADNTNGTTTADPNIGWTTAVQTDGVIDLSTPDATMDTIGELEAWINASTDWRMMINGALRADSSDNRFFTLSAAQAKVDAGLKLYQDEGITPFKLGFSITNRRFNGINSWETDQGYQNGLHYLSLHLTSTGGVTVNLYEIDDNPSSLTLQNNTSETLLATQAVASATALTEKYVLDWGGPILAGVGKRLFVEIVGAAAVSMPSPTSAASFVKALGSSTKVLSS